MAPPPAPTPPISQSFLQRHMVLRRSGVMIGRSGNAESIQKRHFFGLPLAAGSCCELDTSSLGQGVALAVSQVALAAPLPSASDNIQLFCNGVFLCALTHDQPNARLPFNPASKPSLDCVGPEGSGVHIVGYTYVHAKKRKRSDDKVGDVSRAEYAEYEKYMELQRARTRRVEELQREAAAEAARPSVTPTPTRTRRLSFNPEVVAAMYSPKECGISPEVRLSLDEMVARREEIKARQELESMGDDEDEGGEDDGEALQHVLAVLIASSVAKLRGLCKANGLVRHGEKSTLIERLVEHIATDMREGRRRA